MLPNDHGAPTIVTHRSGAQFAIQIRSHEIIVDQTLRGGGGDLAPAPIELLGAALGSCIAYYVNQYLRARALPCEGMRVEVIQTKATNPNRVESFDVSVVLPAELPAAYIPVVNRVIKTCPAHNTLELGARVKVEIQTAAPEAVPA